MGQKFKIEIENYDDKSLDVTIYKKVVKGVEIKILHDIPTASGVEYRWLQTVYENGSFFRACRLEKYVDPWKNTGRNDPKGNAICAADDDKPFYWTDSEFKTTDGPYFYDKPTEPPPTTGRTFIQFTTSLGEVKAKNVTLLASLRWGFTIIPDGTVQPDGLRLAVSTEVDDHIAILKRMYASYTYRAGTIARSNRWVRPSDYSCTRR